MEQLTLHLENSRKVEQEKDLEIMRLRDKVEMFSKGFEAPDALRIIDELEKVTLLNKGEKHFVKKVNIKNHFFIK